MKAKQILIENNDQIEKAEGMGMECDPVYNTKPLLFKIDQVGYAGINNDGYIELGLMGIGEFLIEFDQKIWDKLEMVLNG